MLKVNSQSLKVHNKTIPQGRTGFVVLYTVLIATIILAITIGISLIAYNEVILSSSAAEGGEAFFAADSGAECALYYDRQNPSLFDEFLNNPTLNIISCGKNSPLPSLNYTNVGGEVRFFLEILNEDFTEVIGCARVLVNKSPGGDLVTQIESLGYNIKCITLQDYELGNINQLPPRTIQRAIRVTY